MQNIMNYSKIEDKTMTREEIKELLPIIQAFADGKTIEFKEFDGEWKEAHTPTWSSRFIYRIKQEPKYIPFKTQDECWNEILKHNPVGWIKNKETKEYYNILGICNIAGNIKVILSTNQYTFSSLLNEFTFVDDTPFGIKEV